MMDTPILGGWIQDPEQVDRHLSLIPRPLFSEAAPRLSGSGTDETVLLYKAFKDVNQGAYFDYPAQTIGDCVGQGFGHGIDLLSAAEISIRGENMGFVPTSTEAVYGMARVDIGGQIGSYSDGAVGAWAARAVRVIGTVGRDVVGPYDGRRSRDWGARGLPPELKTIAARHRVRTVSMVSTFEELEDAIANGYPVPVCSTQGFTMVRDAEGFCSPQGVWGHCMLIVGIRGGSRPGACIFQSWGPKLPTGPLGLDQPPNSFWADREVVVGMLACRDSWALSQFEGYPPRAMPEHWSYDGFA
ncbi:hypothetical protein P12x_003573 [Tundrisphaera lichenicola]|uniref:hypothetical protein n=1 Tax=Tundrisphaera lichenicola TaxID=2029860 RepID=UPI003EB88C17